MNQQIGGLRFLVKQLEVVQILIIMGNSESARRYAQDKLHLAAHEDGIMHWINLATTAMQSQARAVIEQHNEAFFDTFGPKAHSAVAAFELGVRVMTDVYNITS